MKEVSTVMIPSDFEGDIWNSRDCPGHRAFKRACRKNLPWYSRISIRYSWAVTSGGVGGGYVWKSYHTGSTNPMDMMESSVGDKVTFRRDG